MAPESEEKLEIFSIFQHLRSRPCRACRGVLRDHADRRQVNAAIETADGLTIDVNLMRAAAIACDPRDADFKPAHGCAALALDRVSNMRMWWSFSHLSLRQG